MLPDSPITHAIATIEPAPPMPQPATLSEWGLTGAAIFLILQKGWEMLNHKEAAESALINSLVGGLRDSQQQLLSQLLQIQERQHSDLINIKDALVGFTTVTRSEIQEGFKIQREALDRLQAEVQELKRNNKII